MSKIPGARLLRFVDANGAIREIHFDATGRDIHIDQPLSEILINYRPAGAVGDSIFPNVPSEHQSDVFYKFDQGDLWRREDSIRAPLTAAKQIFFKVSSEIFYARNFALGSAISVEDLSNADRAIAIRESRGMFLRDSLALDKEARVAALVTAAANVSTQTNPQSGQWGLHAASDPIFDLDEAIEQMRRQTGYRPNRAVFGPRAWRHFKRNDNVRQLIYPQPGGTTGPGLISTGQVATIFDLEEVRVAEMVQNTGLEGLDMSLADIWGPHVLLYFTPGRPSRENPSYAYTFRWQVPGAPGLEASTYFDRAIKGEILEVSEYVDERIIAPSLAVLVSSVE